MAVSPALHVDRRIVRRLQSAGAFSPQTAKPLEPLSPIEERRLRRLMQYGAVCEAAPGRYYVDPAAYGALRRRRRNLAFGSLLAVLLVYVLMLFTCA